MSSSTNNTEPTTQNTYTNNSNVERKGQVECGCKAIKFHVREGPETYNKVSQPAVLCHCNDCVGFAKICYEAASSSRKENEKNTTKKEAKAAAIDVVDYNYMATYHVFFHKSNVTCRKGYNDIGWHTLTEGSPVKRFYCTKCYTSLGAIPDGFGSIFFYGNLIKKRTQTTNNNDDDTTTKEEEEEEEEEEYYDPLKESYLFPKPMYALQINSAPSIEYTNKHNINPNITKYSTLPIYPIIHFMGRKFIGYVLGMNDGTFNFPKDDTKFSVGRETETIGV